MSATILYRSPGTSTDKCLSIVSASACRTLSVGSNWNRLRIGILWGISGSNVDIINTPRTAFGLSNGSIQFFNSSSSATHFFGLWGQDGSSSLSLPASYPNLGGGWGWTFQSIWGNGPSKNSVNIWKVENGVSTIITRQNDNNLAQASLLGFTPNKSMTILDYTKQSPSWSFASGHGFGSGYDSPFSELYNWCTQITPTYTPVGSYGLYSSVNALIDEATYGNLDTICFYWSPTTHAAYISDIIVSKIP
jgi:hypothetical protein